MAARAQGTTADIVGTVADASGSVVAGAAVAATNLATGVVSTGMSEANGTFFLRLLPPGHYSVKAELPGFKAWVLHDVTLAVGDVLRLEPRLEIGQVTESIEVTAAQPALQTETSNVASLIAGDAVHNLPVASDNFVNLLVLASGAGSDQVRSTVGSVTDHRPATAITINGFTGGSNNWLLDGMDDNERFDAVVMVRPSMDAIQELVIETNKYSAVFGRTSGGVINIITKSGTNEPHGSLFESMHNDALDARNLFATAGVVPKPAWKENIFGGSLGGPIKKDNSFIFGDYQGSRMRYGQVSTVAVPTDANRAGLFTQVIYDPLSTRPDPAKPGQFLRDPFPSANGVTNIANYINPVSKNVLALWPEPNGGSAASPTWTQGPERMQRDDRFDSRLDHRIGASDSMFARYSFDNCWTFLPSQLPVVNGINPGGGRNPGPDSVQAQVIGLNYIHTFSPSLVLEVKPGYNRIPPRFCPRIGARTRRRKWDSWVSIRTCILRVWLRLPDSVQPRSVTPDTSRPSTQTMSIKAMQAYRMSAPPTALG